LIKNKIQALQEDPLFPIVKPKSFNEKWRIFFMKSTKERVSYCIGLETGKNLKQQFNDIDLSLLFQGFQDGLSDADPKLSSQEIAATLTSLRSQIELQQKNYIAQLAEKNKKEGEQFLQQNKEKSDVIALPSGLQYKVISKGAGTTNPTLFDNVSIHYTGSFINGKVFDSSYQRGEPVVFPVNRVIPGWSEVLQLMKEGDKWQVFIPHYLAYGEHGFGREIGPNSTLVFDIECLAINPTGQE
jgi:FKBP-type peptidyl-prolyl cis-trans isomerase FklB